MQKIIGSMLAFVALVILGNGLYITYPAYSAIAKDPRNSAVLMVPYLRAGLDPSTLVIDIWRLTPTTSMADVDRILLDVAAGLKGRSFSKVYLAYRGAARLSFDGRYFRTLGEERDWQNPVYTIRTMPENARKMDGTRAFSSWTGGMLGVVNAQMKDHQQMHRIWYFDDIH
ncbi:hypothetical protein OEG84_04385 [Hoeflea sp. G2-23]|uniref:Uncharacterized protein n=1 Tax=Hoeflea algicola TaxID=2983763 RepID=A0ABT3Z6G7_9HYPH|nr:hypothetical protein [Hoeflea algicola]MCY0146974.1 hypothetical protein [Hoeflea algicola]